MGNPARESEEQGLALLLARVGPYVFGIEASRVRAVAGAAGSDCPRLDLRTRWGCRLRGPGKRIALARLGERIELVVDEILEVATMPCSGLRALPPPLDRAPGEAAAVGLALVQGVASQTDVPFALLLDVSRLAVSDPGVPGS
jgi:hypothetical protein